MVCYAHLQSRRILLVYRHDVVSHVSCKWNMLHHEYYIKRKEDWYKNSHWSLESDLCIHGVPFCPSSFVVVRLYHTRIPDLLIRNGLSSQWCSSTPNPLLLSVVQAELPSANHPTRDREQGHSQQYQSHQKRQAHKIVRKLSNVSAKSIQESISHSQCDTVFVVAPESKVNIPWWFAHIISLEKKCLRNYTTSASILQYC